MLVLCELSQLHELNCLNNFARNRNETWSHPVEHCFWFRESSEKSYSKKFTFHIGNLGVSKSVWIRINGVSSLSLIFTVATGFFPPRAAFPPGILAWLECGLILTPSLSATLLEVIRTFPSVALRPRLRLSRLHCQKWLNYPLLSLKAIIICLSETLLEAVW
jgi:hypothetical protein